MNLNIAKELVKKGKEIGGTEACKRLTSSFEAFVNVYQKRTGQEKNPEFLKELTDAHKKFWASLDAVAQEFGFSVTDLPGYLNESGQFDVEKWDDARTLRQQETRSAASSSKRKKSRSDRVRI